MGWRSWARHKLRDAEGAIGGREGLEGQASLGPAVPEGDGCLLWSP